MKPCEEQLGALLFFSLEERRLRGRLIGVNKLPLRGEGGADSDLFLGPKGTAWSCVRGELGWILERGSFLREWSGTGTGSPEEQSQHQTCQSTRRVWTALWGTGDAHRTLLGMSCVGPGAGLRDPCGFLPTQHILWFCVPFPKERLCKSGFLLLEKPKKIRPREARLAYWRPLATCPRAIYWWLNSLFFLLQIITMAKMRWIAARWLETSFSVPKVTKSNVI